MFFIVLDLRLTKVGVQRNSFFYAHFRVVFPFVFVRGKTQVRSIQNALAFEVKRPCVLNQMHLRLRCTENSCQFENLFLTKLTG